MNQEFLKELSGQLPALEIKKNEPMAKHTTFKVGGPADIYVTPELRTLKAPVSMGGVTGCIPERESHHKNFTETPDVSSNVRLWKVSKAFISFKAIK